ncbi:MAG: PKD domain-containing protein [Pseudomonadota bacterium]
MKPIRWKGGVAACALLIGGQAFAQSMDLEGVRVTVAETKKRGLRAVVLGNVRDVEVGDTFQIDLSLSDGVSTLAQITGRTFTAGDPDIDERIDPQTRLVVKFDELKGNLSARLRVRDLDYGTTFEGAAEINRIDDVLGQEMVLIGEGSAKLENPNPAPPPPPPPNVPPTAIATVSPTEGDVPVNARLSAESSFDSDGELVDFAWAIQDAGGNISERTGEVANFEFTEPGAYTITLTVTDDDNATATDVAQFNATETPNRAPRFSINAPPEPQKAQTPIRFEFTGSDPDGDPLTYAWDFDGDGEIDSTERTVNWVFEEAGVFTVSLTATDPEGLSDTAQRTIQILPPNQPPIAAISCSAVDDISGSFSCSGADSSDPDGEVVSYSWTFDAGQFGSASGSGEQSGATFNFGLVQFETIRVTLTVADEEGLSDTQLSLIMFSTCGGAGQPLCL